MAKGGAKPGERRGGRKKGTPNKNALVRLDEAAAVLSVQVAKLKAEDKLQTLGKDRLAEIDHVMYRLGMRFAPKEVDEAGNPVVPYWSSDADEMRFLRFLGLSYDCAKARTPYESPRINPVPENLHEGFDEDDGEDPRESLARIVEGWIEADAKKRAALAIDVTPKAEPVVEVKPNPDDEGIDGELA